MDNNTNLNQLRVFHSVATWLNFTRAAEELHLTQPGISKYIRDLEAHYGDRLFNRLGKKVALTQAGEILFKAVTEAFRLIDEANIRINDLKGLIGGRLNIGASIMIGTYLLPSVLAKFRRRYPGVDISLDIALSQQIQDNVLDNTLEVGLVGHHPEDKRLIVQKFNSDRMVLIVSTGHNWAERRSTITLREVVDQTFLLPRQGSGTRSILEDLFERSGIRLKHTIELGTTEGVKKGVEAGLGISIISQHIVRSEIATGLIKSLTLKGANLRRDLYLVYRKDRYLSAAAQEFLKDVGNNK
jgi:DNA-binding transcriptional LysR family regulator